MIEPVTFINGLLAIFAILFGLASRNFSTALVAGLFMGLVHAGLIALVAAQTGSTAVKELPYLKDGVDMAMQSGHLTFANARFAAYLVAIVLTTLAVMIVAFIVRWLIVNVIGFGAPKRAAM
jgi:hypothetical protein